MLLAANPQHFGRLGELNTVEALAAALVVLGRRAQAQSLLAGFAGGNAFLAMNAERFGRYARARSGAAIARSERLLFGGG
jgi:pre-rRNA-processing protein TSR3